MKITFYDAIFFLYGWIHILCDYSTYKVTIVFLFRPLKEDCLT